MRGETVKCTSIIGPKIDGYVEAEYIVEIGVKQPAPLSPPRCSSFDLAADLTALRSEWGPVLATTKAAGDAITEHINPDQYLAYDSP